MDADKRGLYKSSKNHWQIAGDDRQSEIRWASKSSAFISVYLRFLLKSSMEPSNVVLS